MAERIQERKTLSEVLSEQLKRILTMSGITNLHVEDDGTLSGQTTRITNYPTTHYLKDIRIEIVDDKLQINADISGSSENTGSVI